MADKGLIQRLVSTVGGVLSNPTVQGIAGAAAFGANPLVGLLAAPGIKAARDRRRLENDLLRGDIREQSQRARHANEVATFVGGVLGADVTGQSGIPDSTIPLPPGQKGPEAPAPQTGPPAALSQDAVRQKQRSDFLQLVAKGNPADALNMVGGLLGFGARPERAETSLVRNMRSAGIDPSSPEGRELIVGSIRGGDLSQQMGRLQALSAENQLMRQQEELRAMRADRDAKQLSQTQMRTDLANTLRTDVERAFEVADLLDGLEGSIAQPGELSQIRQFGVGLAGLVSPESRQLSAASERFNQLATGFGLRSLETLRGTGTISDQKFSTLLRNSMSGAKSPEANRLALADQLQETLNAADKMGIDVPRERIEGLLERLRSRGEELSDIDSTGGGATNTQRFRFDPTTGQLTPQ